MPKKYKDRVVERVKKKNIIGPTVSFSAFDQPDFKMNMRSDINTLNIDQVDKLRNAFNVIMADESNSGFQQIAAFHGQPNWCPSPESENKKACCAHGMPVFPHWHRLHTVQVKSKTV